MKGFSLLELFIVLAIIGILASIAIPSYCNYTVPARVSQVMANAAPLKIAVDEYYQKYKNMPDASVLISKLDATEKKYLNAVRYLRYSNTSAAIIYQFSQQLTGTSVVKTAQDKTLVLRASADASGKIAWDCRGGDLPDQYRPRACRK